MSSTKLILLLILLSTCFIFSCQEQEKPEDLRAIAKQLNKGMEDAFARGDMEGVANFYGKDAYMLSPGRNTIQGEAVILKYWKRFQNPISWKLEVIEVAKSDTTLFKSDYWQSMKDKPPHWDKDNIVISEKENVFYQLGHSALAYEYEDGTHHTSHVDFILVWKKYPDVGYKIFIDTYH